MTDRDFKLLVREYFQAKSQTKYTINPAKFNNAWAVMDDVEKKILSELERFTKQEIESLPFKDKK